MTATENAAVHAIVVGASGGLGFAVAQALIERDSGLTVWATAREHDKNAALRSLRASHPGRVHGLSLDLTSEDSIAVCAAAVARELETSGGHLALLFNAAGVLHDDEGMRPERRLADVDAASVQRSFAVNALGPLLIARHFGPLLPLRERTVMANVSARVGSITDNRLGGWYGYRTAKAAQNMITRNLAIELRRRSRGVICVALHPGTVDTSLSAPFQGNLPPGQLTAPEFAAARLLDVVDSLRPEDNGSFRAWDGSSIPW